MVLMVGSRIILRLKLTQYLAKSWERRPAVGPAERLVAQPKPGLVLGNGAHVHAVEEHRLGYHAKIDDVVVFPSPDQGRQGE